MQSNTPGYNFDPTLEGFDNPESFNCLGPDEASIDTSGGASAPDMSGMGAFTARLPEYCATDHPERLSPDQRLDCGFRPSLNRDEQAALDEWKKSQAAQAAGITAGGHETVSGFYPFGNSGHTSGGEKSYKKWILVAVAVGVGLWGLYKIYHKYNLGSYFGNPGEDDDVDGPVILSNPGRKKRRQVTRKRSPRPRRGPPSRPKCSTPYCRGRAMTGGELCEKCAPEDTPQTDYVKKLKGKIQGYKEDPAEEAMAALRAVPAGMMVTELARMIGQTKDSTTTLVEGLESEGRVSIERNHTDRGVKLWVKSNEI